jgi:hypothetical protein
MVAETFLFLREEQAVLDQPIAPLDVVFEVMAFWTQATGD